jgi:DNA-3-methyladenine glycosylase II
MTSTAQRNRPVLGHALPSQCRRLLIEPSAPFRLDLTVWALRRRAHNEVDRWTASGTYGRVVSLDGRTVSLAVTQEGGPMAPRLSVVVSGGTVDARDEALARSALDTLLGLGVDLSAFAAVAAADPVVGPLAERMRGVKPPRFPTVFEALVNAVACQQLSLTVGIHLLNRLTAAHGRAASDGRAFPDPAALAPLEPEELKRHGFSTTKARTIIDIARAIATGDLDLEALHRLDDVAAVERLTALRGIGRWTAEYVLLRGLGRLHVFPGDDIGAQNKLKRLLAIETPLDYEGVRTLVARWHPFAGLVYFHLLLDALTRSQGGPRLAGPGIGAGKSPAPADAA